MSDDDVDYDPHAEKMRAAAFTIAMEALDALNADLVKWTRRERIMTWFMLACACANLGIVLWTIIR